MTRLPLVRLPHIQQIGVLGDGAGIDGRNGRFGKHGGLWWTKMTGHHRMSGREVRRPRLGPALSI
jgi:hypothetical protein